MNPLVGVLLLGCGLLAGCAAPVVGLYPPQSDEPTKTVHVINHGWHSGLAIARADLVATRMPVLSDFPHADYLEFGWGDADYYRTPHPTFRVALKAVLCPTPSVLHVAGVRGALTNSFPQNEIVAVRLSEAGFHRLCRFVDESFRRDYCGNLLPAGTGFYGDGKFYHAVGKFHFPRMCNW
ncbi:MAG: DUF2459 domain-containing protein, partial [Verrucomicrobiae bacterium]|nr:DUF2459 domain-containing protein [Verrucomicrobiae bacterium]